MEKIMIGSNQNKQNVFFDGQSSNPHCFAVGKSGCGKTTSMLYQLVQEAEKGKICVVINWHRAIQRESLFPEIRRRYEQHVKVIDVAENGIQVPLFTPCVDTKGQSESEEMLVHRITALLKTSCDLTPTQESQVHLAVKSIYRLGLYKTEGISAVSEWLYQQKKAVAANAAAKIGALSDSNLLKNGNFWNEVAPIVEFDLNGLEYSDQLVVTKFLADYILRLANRGQFLQKGITLFIDECQNLEFHQGSTMSTLLNESRRLNLRVMLAAPTIIHQKGMDVMRQCGLRLYFEPFDHERKLVANFIDALHPEVWVFILSRLKRGEYVACGNFYINGKEVMGVQQLSCVLLTEKEKSKVVSSKL